MPRLPRELETAFHQFDAMLDAHIQGVQAYDHAYDQPPDLAKYNFERSRAFEDLKTRLTLTLKEARSGTSEKARQLAAMCQARMALIQKKDRLLEKYLAAYHDRLTMRKAHMLRGKRALRGYQYDTSSYTPKNFQRPG